MMIFWDALFMMSKLCETRLEQRLEQRNTTGMVNSSPSAQEDGGQNRPSGMGYLRNNWPFLMRV